MGKLFILVRYGERKCAFTAGAEACDDADGRDGGVGACVRPFDFPRRDDAP